MDAAEIPSRRDAGFSPAPAEPDGSCAREEVVVIGAGAAGLGVAGELARRGHDPLVLERAEQLGGGWKGRYENLRLNTVPHFSSLPRKRIRDAGRWMAASEYGRYLARYARERSLRIETGVGVQRIDREGTAWRAETDVGTVRARSLVVAAGFDLVPELPDWPGRMGFAGELIHSASYRRPEPFVGRGILIAGAGNSGTEIACELAAAGAARVRLAVRTPPNLMPEAILGVSATWLARANEAAPRPLVDAGARLIQRLAFGDLRGYGIGRAPLGIATELHERGRGPVLDRGFVASLKRHEIEVVAAIDHFAGAEAVLVDGARLRPDAVIAATGFSHGLEPLVGHLGVLDERGRPRRRRGQRDPDNPGLFFNGYWLPLSGQLPGMQRTAPRIAKAIAKRAANHRAPR